MKNILQIIRLAKPLRGWVYLLSFLVLLVALLNQATPLMLKFIVDEAEKQISTGDGDLNRIYTLVLITFGITLLAIFITAVNERVGDFVASRLRKFLTEKFYEKVFTLPQSYFDNEISGKIVNQLVRGIETIQDFIGTASNFVLPALLQSVFTIAILFYFNWIVGLLALSIFPIYIGISRYSTKKWGEKEIKKNQIEDVARGRIQEVISNIKLIKSFNTQSGEWNYIEKKLSSINEIYDKQSSQYHILNFLRNMGLEIVLVMVIAVVFTSTFQGDLTFGDLVMILQYLAQLRRPLVGMSFILERVQAAESGSKEYFDVMNLVSDESLQFDSDLKEITDPSIKFDNVTFQYDEKTQVLENVSFEIGSKEKVALVGHSGAGKTTITNLILKFYKPTDGDISISGKSYKELSHADIRNNISLVFQDSELLSTTIRENVAYGMEDPSEKEIIKALKNANAYDFVMKLPNKLETEIGERGVRLSGGQKQRIQIARALMHNKPILILDEATSSLDAKSEKLVQDAIDKLVEDRLVIIIAHRFSTIQNVDRVIVLDHKSIVDSGNPGELAQKKGIYSELLRYQIEGNKKLLEKYELS